VVAMLRAVQFASTWCVSAKLLGRNLVGGVLRDLIISGKQ